MLDEALQAGGRRRWRIARRALLFLLLGAIVNVAVAWSISARSSILESGATARKLGAFVIATRPLSVQWHEDWGRTALEWKNLRHTWLKEFFPAESPGTAEDMVKLQLEHFKAWQSNPKSPVRDTASISDKPPTWGSPTIGAVADDDRSFVDHGAGWPLRTLFYSHRPEGIRGGWVVAESSVGGRPNYTSMPLWPIWKGFAINTIFYAAILWVLFATPRALNRKRRRMRGLCVKCAYDLRGRGAAHEVCPECGSPVVASITKPVQPASSP